MGFGIRKRKKKGVNMALSQYGLRLSKSIRMGAAAINIGTTQGGINDGKSTVRFRANFGDGMWFQKWHTLGKNTPKKKKNTKPPVKRGTTTSNFNSYDDGILNSIQNYRPIPMDNSPIETGSYKEKGPNSFISDVIDFVMYGLVLPLTTPLLIYFGKVSMANINELLLSNLFTFAIIGLYIYIAHIRPNTEIYLFPDIDVNTPVYCMWKFISLPWMIIMFFIVGWTISGIVQFIMAL